jgi:hypothetical protein
MPRARIAALAAAVPLAAAALAFFLRRRPSGPPPPPAPPAGSAPDETSAQQRIEHEWTCECGQVFRIAGEGRHTLFWLPAAPVSHPLLEDRCPNCDRSLLGQHVAAQG